MKKLQILNRIFKQNKNLDFVSKIYLYKDYTTNLKLIKKENGLGYLNMILYMKIFNHDLSKINKKNEIVTNKKIQNLDLPDLEKELNDIKTAINRRRLKNMILFLLKFIKILDIRHLIDLKNSQNNIQQLFVFMSKQIENYKKSLQELVEGQREVTQNKSFKFEDGETVQNKIDEFELKIKEYFNIQDKLNKLKK